MKTQPNRIDKHAKAMSHKPRPEVRDDLDSRKNEEWLSKKDNVTHPHKEHKSERKRVK